MWLDRCNDHSLFRHFWRQTLSTSVIANWTVDTIGAVNLWSSLDIYCHFARLLINAKLYLITFTLDEFLAVGSAYPANNKAELYNFGSGTWKTVDDYPFCRGMGCSDYDMLYIPETSSYLVIGGDSSRPISQIARFKDGAWSDAGKLNSARVVSFCSFLLFQTSDPI